MVCFEGKITCLDRKNMKKYKIMFWKAYAIFWDLRPRMHLPKFKDLPIANADIAEKYEYPEGCKILFEWDEKGKHWIVFSR